MPIWLLVSVDFCCQEDTKLLQQPSISADRMCKTISSMSYCIIAGACGTHVLPHATKLWNMSGKRELITLVYLQRVAHGSLMWQFGDSTKSLPLMHMSVQ